MNEKAGAALRDVADALRSSSLTRGALLVGESAEQIGQTYSSASPLTGGLLAMEKAFPVILSLLSQATLVHPGIAFVASEGLVSSAIGSGELLR